MKGIDEISGGAMSEDEVRAMPTPVEIRMATALGKSIADDPWVFDGDLGLDGYIGPDDLESILINGNLNLVLLARAALAAAPRRTHPANVAADVLMWALALILILIGVLK